MKFEPVALREWQKYEAEHGAILQLTYIAPETKKCDHDASAYGLVIQKKGVAGWNLGSMGFWGVAHSVDIPVGGWRRLGNVVEMFVSLPYGGKLVDLLQASVEPCDKAGAQYTLAVVNLMSPSSNFVRNAFGKVQDATMDRAVSGLNHIKDDADDFKKKQKPTIPSLREIIMGIVVPIGIVLAVYFVIVVVVPRVVEHKAVKALT